VIYIYKTKKKKIPPRNQKNKNKEKETEPPGLSFGECIAGALFLDGVDQLDLRWWVVQSSGTRVVVVLESDI